MEGENYNRLKEEAKNIIGYVQKLSQNRLS